MNFCKAYLTIYFVPRSKHSQSPYNYKLLNAEYGGSHCSFGERDSLSVKGRLLYFKEIMYPGTHLQPVTHLHPGTHFILDV